MSNAILVAVAASLEMIDCGQTQAARDSLCALERTLRTRGSAPPVGNTHASIIVDREALTRVLQALTPTAPGHLIRELQMTQGELFPDNPITVLCNQLQSQTG